MKKKFKISFANLLPFFLLLLVPTLALHADDKFPYAQGQDKVINLPFKDYDGVVHRNEKVLAFEIPGQTAYFEDSKGNKYVIDTRFASIGPTADLVGPNVNLNLAAQGYTDQNGNLTALGKKAQADGYIDDKGLGLVELTDPKGVNAATNYNDTLNFSSPSKYFSEPPKNPPTTKPPTTNDPSNVTNPPTTNDPSNVTAPLTGGLKNPLAVNTIFDFFNAILKVAVKIGGIVIVLALVYCGFLFVKAQGNSEELETAKRAFLWTIIGAGVILGAEVFSQIINATINNLQ